MKRIIAFSLQNRWLVLASMVGLLAGGIYVMLHIAIDAFPDLTNNQVLVTTEAPGMSPTEVEQLVTFPIETALIGMPKTQVVRSISKLGLSMVTVIFNDNVDIYLARQLTNERLSEARSRIPSGLEPRLGPLATAFGEVLQYTLEGGASLMERKTLQDWRVRYDLRTVPGVSEVNAWGGETKQYTVEVDPLALRRYNLTLRDILQRVQSNNSNFGGGFIVHGEEQYNVRGLGRVSSVKDLERIVVLASKGVPVLLRDVANVTITALPRQGAVTRNAKGETVAGMVIILKGENGRKVLDSVKAKIATMQLPHGVKLVPFYDQSEVIDGTIHTVKRNLIEAGVLVTIILLVFLGNVRAALLVALVIPLAMLFGFLGMAVFGISANLMSLGAIDFGMIVDGSVVMIENIVRRSGQDQKDWREGVLQASQEVARPIIFGVLIIIAVYLPIFTLQDLEGRMFRPMAITVCSALFGSLLLALFLMPTLASFVIKPELNEKQKPKRDGWFDKLRNRYGRSLEWVERNRWPVLAVAVVTVVVSLVSVKFLGTEFMPKLDEGSILITSRRLPGISLPDSVAVGKQIEKIIMSFPEIKSVVTKLGRPDLATEAMGIYESDSYLQLQPQDQWHCCKTSDELAHKIADKLAGVPGVAYNVTQPMAMRMDEVVTGIRGDLAIKIFGEDTQVLSDLAKRTLAIITTVKGASEPQMEITTGVPELLLEVRRDQLDRYGLNVSDIQELTEILIGQKQVSEVIEGQQRFPLALSLPDSQRQNVDALAGIWLSAPGGERVRLDQVASVKVSRGPEIISRENARRRVVVQSNVRGTDLGSFVAAARQKVEQNMKLPPGYSMEWGGQFENQHRANQRLMIVLPVSILIIFGLLFATFHNVKQALLILLNVPFALVGGIAALWLRGLNLNLSASIGFIALFGVAVLNGIVMVSHINALREQGKNTKDAIKEGAADRLRPVLMTALVASLGFVPMAISQARGSEVQRPLATVVIGGLFTATILTLYLLPVLYTWFSPKEQVGVNPPNTRKQTQDQQLELVGQS